MSNQITEVRLLNVPLENDYKHTLYFSSKSAQASYFQGRTVFSGSDFSYQRKDGIIRYPKSYDELSNCNYVMYRNPGSSKWVYAFITEKKYINDERTDLTIETDVLQTYLGEYTIKPSFVEREHASSDNVGENTVPENLELGEFVSVYDSKISELQSKKIVIARSALPSMKPAISLGEEDTTISGGRYNGLYSGLSYVAFEETEVSQINAFLQQYDESGKADAIQSMFYAPSFLAERKKVGDIYLWDVLYSEVPKSITHQFNKPNLTNTITSGGNSYTFRNNKLKTFPFQYLLVSNNNGASAVYHYENFLNDTLQFNIYGVLTPGCSIRMIPKNYKGVLENNEEGLNLGKYPICNWTSDVYTNWLTQNSVNIGLNIASGIGQMVAGGALAVATGGAGIAVGGGQIASGASAIAGQLAQIHQMSFTPPQARGNINSGDVTTATHNNTFTFYGMSIKPEIAAIIDNYFDMFGYKCNRVKVPESNHRQNYWYTKTIDVSIDGAITAKDMQTIKNCYNNGVTFWKNSSNIGNYSVSNSSTSVG